MARARQRDTWQRTATILSMLFNANRGKEPPRAPNDFMPRSLVGQDPEPELTVAEMGAHAKASGWRSVRVQRPS